MTPVVKKIVMPMHSDNFYNILGINTALEKSLADKEFQILKLFIANIFRQCLNKRKFTEWSTAQPEKH
jgi:hypothetical protein